MKKVSPRVQLGAEFATNPFNATESAVSMGAEFRMKQSTYACSIDGTGKIDASLETRFFPMASLILTGQLNHPQNQQRFGEGFSKRLRANALQLLFDIVFSFPQASVCKCRHPRV